ncbi:MAG: double-strand break repair protein AddB [Xanthobacteraceae bacterium]|nr:double-strand break repair protein AddB [Xanthobacteraceae bacterium]
MKPRVFTVPPSAPFLPALLGALAGGRLVEGLSASDPLAFAATTIFLPTRRACRLARDAFLDVLGVEAALLPRIVPIGDIDEDELVFADIASGAGAADALDLPPALGGLERRFLLAKLVHAWASAKGLEPQAGEAPVVVRHPPAAFALADDLARLLDDMTTREVPWERLDTAVPDHLDRYWQITLEFLQIARNHWPEILAERGAIEPAERRDRLITAEARRLAASSAPVIAAGSTGSMPATARLLATIARLPRGAVVLPGLDTGLDDAAWNLIGGGPDLAGPPPLAGHPQFAMRGLLARIGIARSDVVTLVPPAPHGREVLLSEALRPAAATDRWRQTLANAAGALTRAMDTLTVIEAANVEEEALAIAVALREALDVPARIAALVTADRALARRVLVTLERWNVTADDSGGDPLAETAAGVFARLVAAAALDRLSPVSLLALLKHPLARFGGPPGAHLPAVATLEQAVLRGPRPRAGSAGLTHALATFRLEVAKLRAGEPSSIHRAEPRAALSDAALHRASLLLERVETALAPLERVASLGEQDFAALAACHREAVIAASLDPDGLSAAFAGPDGGALEAAFADIAEKAQPFTVEAGDYVELFGVVIADRVVRRPGAPESRVRIYGPLEARLTYVDRVVIGGLVEGVWPPDPRTDPWLNRPMRHALGLDLPERRIGLSAHDFAQLAGHPEVFLTRAAKIAGTPTVASRFLQRLAAVAGDDAWQAAVSRGERYRGFGRSLDMPAAPPRPVLCPAPRPPRAARPTRLSVTEIEHWLRDPYTIYAKHILKLPQLDRVDEPPGAADRGTAIHAAIAEFAKIYADRLPADPYGELIRIGRAHFAPLEDYPEAKAFWWPRYERIATWFADFERQRHDKMAAAHVEVPGELAIPLPERSFHLTGRADRIERLADGRYAILDFKTGQVPSDKQVQIGVAPQLTLEGAMLRSGGFPGLDRMASLAELVYVRLKGAEPAGEERVIAFETSGPDAAADTALARLTTLVTRFEDEATPYRSLVLSMWTHRYGTYDDLARVKEWSLGGGPEEIET